MNKPPRILYIQRPTGGGSTISLYELVKGLDSIQYEPIILFLQKNQYIKKFKEVGIKTITLNRSKSEEKRRKRKHSFIGRVYQSIVIDMLLALHIVYIIKKEKIDLIHHNTGLNKPILIAANITGTPQVCHFRMFSNLSYRSKKLARFISSFVYISNVIEKHYTNLGLPSNKGHVIYNPFDKEIFQQVSTNEITNLRIEFGLKKSDYLISNIGRLDSWKGQDYFLKAFAEILKKHPNTKALIVGDLRATQEGQLYYDRLKNITKELNISNDVIFTGHRFDIPNIMVASDIIVHSASKPEPFGRVIVEAMLAGTPIIATKAGGVPEIIEDQITGVLIPLHDVESMVDAIQKVMEDHKISNKMAKIAKKYAKDKFSVQQHVCAIENIYQTILTK
jgi:glycosyltransferase involved in cell wall biosynthesis